MQTVRRDEPKWKRAKEAFGVGHVSVYRNETQLTSSAPRLPAVCSSVLIASGIYLQ